MKYEPVKDHAERKRISALIERCEKEQTMSDDRWKHLMIVLLGIQMQLLGIIIAIVVK